MPAVGKITVQEVDGVRILTDESGQCYTLPARGDYPRLEVDPRIDLTKPIYEQVMKLAARDRAAAARKSKRKTHAA